MLKTKNHITMDMEWVGLRLRPYSCASGIAELFCVAEHETGPLKRERGRRGEAHSQSVLLAWAVLLPGTKTFGSHDATRGIENGGMGIGVGVGVKSGARTRLLL